MSLPMEKESGAHTEKGGSQRNVQSIERAFAILMEVAHNDGISLAELSKRVDLHNSTTFHLVRTLVELGVVRQDKLSKGYRLGRLIFTLAAGSSTEVQLVGTAKPFVEELAKLTGETAHLGLRSGSDAVIVARVSGGGAFQMIERSGGLRPLHCTSIGKVLLAHMTDGQLQRFARSGPLDSFTAKTVTDPDLLLAEVAKIRETGLGYDDCEFNEEVRCVAAPVYDFNGQVVAAIGVSGPIWRINLQRLAQLSEQVRDMAWQTSRELGYDQQPSHAASALLSQG